MELPPVSVIVIDGSGAGDVRETLVSLSQQDYPLSQTQAIVVSTRPSDQFQDQAQDTFKRAEIVNVFPNTVLAQAANIGARRSANACLVFLTSECKAQPTWLRELITPILDARAACAGGTILDSSGKRNHFAGGAVAFTGHWWPLNGKLDPADEDIRPTLFPSIASMAVMKDTFLKAGGFDPTYGNTGADVDFGWRLHLMGRDVVIAPRAVTILQQGCDGKSDRQGKDILLDERNALRTIMKNYGDENMHRLLPAALLLAIKRAAILSNINPDEFRVGTEHRKEIELSPETIAHLAAMKDIMDGMDKVFAERDVVQKRRTIEDEKIFPLLEPFRRHVELGEVYERAFRETLDFFDIRRLFERGR